MDSLAVAIRSYRAAKPLLVSRWADSSTVYRWIGNVVRLKPSYWGKGEISPYGIVTEVGYGRMLGVVWATGEVRGGIWMREVDGWWKRGIAEFKERVLARGFSEPELVAIAKSIEAKNLIKDSR